MSTDTSSELERFHQFVAEQLDAERDLTPEQALALWRERNETIAAVREALDAVNAGQTRPVDEFIRDFQKRLSSDLFRA